MSRSENKVRLDISLTKETFNNLVTMSNSFTEKGFEVHTKSQILEEAFKLYVIFLSERVNEEMKNESKKGD